MSKNKNNKPQIPVIPKAANNGSYSIQLPNQDSEIPTNNTISPVEQEETQETATPIISVDDSNAENTQTEPMDSETMADITPAENNVTETAPEEPEIPNVPEISEDTDKLPDDEVPVKVVDSSEHICTGFEIVLLKDGSKKQIEKLTAKLDNKNVTYEVRGNEVIAGNVVQSKIEAISMKKVILGMGFKVAEIREL